MNMLILYHKSSYRQSPETKLALIWMSSFFFSQNFKYLVTVKNIYDNSHQTDDIQIGGVRVARPQFESLNYS
jgi:hypothetical protein